MNTLVRSFKCAGLTQIWRRGFTTVTPVVNTGQNSLQNRVS